MFKNTAPDGKANLAGKFLHEYRILNRLSVRDLAARLQLGGLDWDFRQVSRAENGLRTISDIELRMISEILETSLDTLLGSTEPVKEA